MKRRTLYWLGLMGALILAYVLAASMIGRQRARQEETRPTSYSADPKGCKAAYLFLRQSGLSVSRRRDSWRQDLPEQGMLIVSEPVIPPSAAEQKVLRRWVERGGTLLILAKVPWNTWKVRGEINFGSWTSGDFPPLLPGPLTRGIGHFRLAASWRLRDSEQGETSAARPPVVLAGDGNGAAILHASHGRGRAILVADPGFISNSRLKEAAGNSLFLLNLAGSFGIRRVQFDEYHLGMGKPSESVPMVQLPLVMRLIRWQLLFLAALYFYMIGRRFGRPVALPETGGRTITEYISSMAALYQRAQAGSVALDHLYHGLTERMRLVTGLSSSASPETLARAVAGRLGADQDELFRLMLRCQKALSERRISQAELLSLAKRIDYYRKELEKWVTLPR